MTTNNSALLAELLVCSTAIGAGTVPAFPNLYDHGGLIFASPVAAEMKTRLRHAETMFTESRRRNDRNLNRTIMQLEADVALGVTGATRSLEEARELQDSDCFPYCHDVDAVKALLLEMVTRSRHRHVTLLDAGGFRINMALLAGNYMTREIAMLPMTVGRGMDQALVRVNGTGGMLIHTKPGRDHTSFTYVSTPAAQVIERLTQRLAKKSYLSPLKGSAVLIGGYPPARPVSGISTDDILRLMTSYYVNGHKPDAERATFVFESLDMKDEWQSMLQGERFMEVLGIPQERMSRVDKAMYDFHLSAEVGVAFATRAVLCKAALDSGCAQSIRVTRAHFELMKDFVRVLFEGLAKHIKAADKQSDSAAKARQAKHELMAMPPADRQAVAMDAIRAAVAEAPGGMISRRTATRLAGVTTALLDYLVANNGELVELTGRSQIKMGATERAYTLRSVTHMDLGEAIDELDEAMLAYATDKLDPQFYDMERVKQEVIRVAEDVERNDEEGMPAVPITRLQPRQIRQLPALLTEYPDLFQLRGTAQDPEPPHLLRSDDDPDAPLEPGVPNVWVRRKSNGDRFRNWKETTKLGFQDIWGD